MESTKTSRGALVAILVVTVAGLVALDIYQDRIIERQRNELRWLMTHSIIRPDAVAADAAKSAPSQQGAAKNDSPKTPAADVAVVPPSSRPAAPAPASKP